MPKISGLKGHAISGLLRDIPENEYGKANMHGCEESTAYNGVPEIGIVRPNELIQDELLPHYFVPNFVRPIPEVDDDPELDDPNGGMYDISQDVSIIKSYLTYYLLFSLSTYSLVCFQSLIGTLTWSANSSITLK